MMTVRSQPMEDFLSQQRLLILSPHADDETIGAGGLMCRVKDAGGEAYVICMSTGNLDHFDKKSGTVAADVRAEELAAAMKSLQVDDFEILFPNDEKHLRLDAIPRRDLVNLIEREARLATEKIRPTMLVLPAPSFNQDHSAVFEAGITATRPHLASMKAFQSTVLVADAPQLTWGSYQFRPNFYLDISHCLNRKLEAFACHRSQQREGSHQGGIYALEQLARTRGTEISVEAAEAFEVLRFLL